MSNTKQINLRHIQFSNILPFTCFFELALLDIRFWHHFTYHRIYEGNLSRKLNCIVRVNFPASLEFFPIHVLYVMCVQFWFRFRWLWREVFWQHWHVFFTKLPTELWEIHELQVAFRNARRHKNRDWGMPINFNTNFLN